MNNIIIGKRPLVFLLIAYIAGIALGHLFSPPLFASLYIVLALLIIIGVACYIIKRPYMVLLGLSLAMLGGGFLNYEFSTRYIPANHISHNFESGKYTIEGRLTSPPTLYASKTVLYLDVERIGSAENFREVSGKLRLTIYQTNLELDYGDRIRGVAKLRIPTNYGNPGSFDYRAYLARQGIRITGSISSNTHIEKLPPGKKSRLFSGIYDLKLRLASFVELCYPRAQAGLLRALVLGERLAVDPAIKAEFTAVGLAHLLAISGLHVGFVGFIFFAGFRFMLRCLPDALFERLTTWVRPSKLAAVLSIPPLIGYTLLVGNRTATVRATIMILAYTLSLLIDRKRDFYNILALAALIILIWKPTSLTAIDFQLSFVTVFFIIYALSAFYKLDIKKPVLVPPGRLKRLGKRLGGYLLVTITASLAATPLTVFYFKHISPLGVLANLLAIPLAWAIIPLGLSAGLLSLVSFSLGELLLKLNLLFVNPLLALVHKLAAIPIASLRMPPPSVPQLILYYGLLLCVFKVKRSAWARIGAVCLLLASGIVWWQGMQPAANTNMLQVTFLDVGHGESCFIRFPGGKTMLIDGGGHYSDSFDVGERVVSEYLWSQGVGRLDWVALSHNHPDHINGLKSVLRNFCVGEVWEAPNPYVSRSYFQFKALLTQKNIPTKLVAAGDNFRLGEGVELFVLNPPRKTKPELSTDKHKTENNRSLVFRISYGQVSFLFTGDIEREAERYLLKQPASLASSILKSPHHGSLTSSSPAFLKAVNPQLAVFSIGPAHQVWHPSPKMYARYERLGIRILRTDQHGAVTIETDGSRYEVSTWRN